MTESSARASSTGTWYPTQVGRISDEELAKALAERLDSDGHDVGLEAWVRSWTPEQRARSRENVRRSIEAVRRQLRGERSERTDV